MLAHATPLSPSTLAAFLGHWTVTEGGSSFGTTLVSSSSLDTVSLFGKKSEVYAVLKVGCLDESKTVVMEGAWRFANTTDTGLVRLFVEPEAASAALCAGELPKEPVSLRGSHGDDSDEPSKGLALTFAHALDAGIADHFEVVAHRGGCRTIDDCGASENSVEVIRMAQGLGASSVEIDVRMTADGVAVLYHDENFSGRLVKGQYCRGPVEDFTLPHIRALCKLTYGEDIPTLEKTLRVIVDDTQLRGVWLDVKTPSAVRPTAELMQNALARARDAKRSVWMVLGMGEQEIVDAFRDEGLAGKTPCLAELSASDATDLGCDWFAPRWTRGPMPSTVSDLQARGISVAFWTLDETDFVNLFLREARPNGLLTNRPGLIYYSAHTVGHAPKGGSQ